MSTPDDVLALLRAATQAADCRRRRVGAVATDLRGRIVGVGWNGLVEPASCLAGDCPRGILSYEQLPACSSYRGNCAAIHAEDSALRMSEKCAVLYVTEQPCPDCEEMIEDYGCEVVVVELATEKSSRS